MASSRAQIAGWFDRMIELGATHMLVVCDTYDYEDYPVYVFPTQSVREFMRTYQAKSMQKVMEVYSASHDKQSQLNERRTFRLD